MTHPVDESEHSAVWATLVVILLVVIVILLVGYFAWWAPSQRDTTVIQKETERVVPVPVPERQAPAPAPAPEQPPGGQEEQPTR